MKIKACILSYNNVIAHEKWLRAVETSNQKFELCDVVDITKNNWWKEVTKTKYDIFLLQAPGAIELHKRLFDERVGIIKASLTTMIYPTLNEVLLYENKRILRDWLVSKEISHPETFVFFDKNEAKKFAKERTEYPIVAKTNIGASGNGVMILRDVAEMSNYIDKAFTVGIKPKTGFKIKKGSLIKKIKKIFKGIGFVKQRLSEYKESILITQYGYVIFQHFIPHSFEWRCVRIGDSFFAHKKMVSGEMASGTLKKGYNEVPYKLLNYIKKITDDNSLHSVSVDLFEYNGSYLVNEIQCFFGQSDPYQMLIDGKPGRYFFVDNNWAFEEGMFNTNESYDLRLEHALKIFKQ